MADIVISEFMDQDAVDSLTGDFHQWSGEKIAKLLNEADERFTGGISH